MSHRSVSSATGTETGDSVWGGVSAPTWQMSISPVLLLPTLKWAGDSSPAW